MHTRLMYIFSIFNMLSKLKDNQLLITRFIHYSLNQSFFFSNNCGLIHFPLDQMLSINSNRPRKFCHMMTDVSYILSINVIWILVQGPDLKSITFFLQKCFCLLFDIIVVIIFILSESECSSS